jgi:hypothetical protein
MTRRALSAFCSPLAVGVLGVGMFFPPQAFSAADSCPNAAVRAQQGATALPDCRAYELVNPPGVDFGETNRVAAISDDGNVAAFMTVLPSDGAFSNGIASTWVGRRGAAGWTSVSADPSTVGSSLLSGEVVPRAFSPDFTKFLFTTGLPLVPGDGSRTEDAFETRVGTGQSIQLTPGFDEHKETIGASTDLSEVVVSSNGPNPPSGMYVSDGKGLELVTGSVAAASGGARRGLGVYDVPGRYNARDRDAWVERGGAHAVSDDAQRIYFYNGQAGSPVEVRDRKSDPARTVPVSLSRRAGDGTEHPAVFISASHDGSTAYIESADQLTDTATPGGGIYKFDLATESLTQITPAAGDPTGLHLSGALAADDQSRIYFTSTAALTGAAQAGDTNAYVWSSAGVRFIAKVDPSDRFERVTPDGTYALLLTTASINGAQNGGFKAVYRYSYATDSMVCASCRPDGTPSDGTAEIETQSFGFPATDVSHSRALTSDGDVVFTTTDRLSADDVTRAQDVYLYHDGSASLLTSGQGDADAFVGDVSDDGDNIFVISRTAFVGADQDASEYDVYDVRVDGGALEPPPASDPCRADDCQGPATAAPADVAPASARVTSAGNAPAAKVVKRLSVSKLTSAQRSSLARTGKVAITAHVTGGGTLSIRGRGKIAGRTTTLGSVRQIVLKRSQTTVRVTFRLSSAARRELSRRHRLGITFQLRLSGLSKAATATANLTRAHR